MRLLFPVILATLMATHAPAQAQNIIAVPATGAAGVALSNNPILDLSQTWEGADAGYPFTAIRVGITDTLSHTSRSRLLEMKVDGIEVFGVRKTGEFTLSNLAGTTVGGMAVRGNLGEMALTSQLHPLTGLPADVIRYGWEAGSVGDAAVIHGMGTNRLSIESMGAIVHVAKNSRYEWEGLSAPTISMIGYQSGSANGRPINFTNAGQAPETATPLYATNVQPEVANIAEFRDGRDEDPVTVAKIEADGRIVARALVLTDLPTADPEVEGAVWNDGGVLKISVGVP